MAESLWLHPERNLGQTRFLVLDHRLLRSVYAAVRAGLHGYDPSSEPADRSAVPPDAGHRSLRCGADRLRILRQLIQFYVSIRDRDQNRDLTGDPWGGRTLEWATSSPPPFYNFAIVPQVHERDAFWEMKEKGEAYKQPAHYEEIHMPKNSGAGIVIAAFATVFGFAMIWHIWWMAIASFIGIVATWIIKSFDEDVDYYVPVAEVEKLEKQHFDEINKAGLKNGN